MRVDVLTIFPGVFPGPLGIGVVGRALESGTLALQAHDLRDHTDDRHRQVDDIPFGGGPGMVLKPEPLGAVEDVEEYPAHEVLVVRDGDRVRRLPMVRAFVERVDLAAGVVVLRPWEEA